MQLDNLKPKTLRSKGKRVGRGGKRGTTSGHGTKGQKSRAGSYVRPGFRGGDSRMWQQYPKQRGAAKKHGNKKPHRKHRYFMLRNDKPFAVNVGQLNGLKDGTTVNAQSLFEAGLILSAKGAVKILAEGELKRKLIFVDVKVSKTAKEKIEKAGGSIKNAESGK